MTDNTDEEHLLDHKAPENPIVLQSGNPADETSISDTYITNPILETKNMEVHHHPHVGKKKFKEYLLEGLMIFLAVTMGFFAESLRENITKHEKEHHLMEMLVEDLKVDIPELDTVIKLNSIKVEYLDSLRHCSYAAAEIILPDTTYRNMYFMHRRYSRNRLEFVPTSRTLNQFEKSDAFNLIRIQAVSDSIRNYTEGNRSVDKQHTAFRDFEKEAFDIGQTIFDYRLYENYLGNTPRELILQSTQNFKLLDVDKKTLLAYGTKLFFSRGTLFNYVQQLKAHKAQAERLLALIEKEYSLVK